MRTRPQPRREAGAPSPASRHGTGGFVVLAALVLVVVVVVALVLLGKVVRYQYPDRYPARFEQRELRFVTGPVEVRRDGRVTARLAPPDSVWTYQLDNGDVVVFRGPRGDEVLGFAPGDALARTRPSP